MANRERKGNTGYTWEIQSQCYHDGEPIWTEDIVEKVVDKLLDRYKDADGNSTVRYAWCNHNKDKYRQENIDDLLEREPDTQAKVGDDRPAHIHLMLSFKNAIPKERLHKIISEFTTLDITYIRKPNAPKHQFLAMITYLTHCRETEQIKGKHIYEDNEVHCNFNYREEVNKYLLLRQNDKKAPSKKKVNTRPLADDMITRLERGKMTLEDAKREAKETQGYAFFLRYEKEFRLARAEFIKRGYRMEPRANYYICGISGSGKSTLSQRLAMALFPDLEDYECFYTVGAQGVRFDDYEGQPVIIWEDIRPKQLQKEFGSEGILNLMELNPKKRAYNIKFGKVILTHQVNIFTYTEDFEDFAKDLMTKEDQKGKVLYTEDCEQVKRRFPVIINIGRANHQLEIRRNTQIYDKEETSVFKKYTIERNVDIPEMNREFTAAALDKAFQIITEPIVHLHERFKKIFSGPDKESEEIFAPKIQVSEGYDKLEAEEQQPGYATYIDLCMKMMYAYQIDEPVSDVEGDDNSLREPDNTPEANDITTDANSQDAQEAVHEDDEILAPPAPSIDRFGPYKSQPGWSLGDALSGDYAGAYCPFTYEQWCDMKKPVGIDYYRFVFEQSSASDENGHDRDTESGATTDTDNSGSIYFTEDRKLNDEYKERIKRFEEHRQELMNYLIAQKTDPKTPLPEGFTLEEISCFKQELSDEEFKQIYGIDEDDIPDQGNVEDEPWVSQYVADLESATREYIETKSRETLKRWIGVLFKDHEYNDIRDSETAWRNVIENWHIVKTACIESEMVRDAREWYGLYQMLNCERTEDNSKEETENVEKD